MKYSVITFGCRVNQADTLGIEGELAGSGAVAGTPESADLVIVNTCSVTATADQAARQAIRRVARQNPSARIVVTGCYATRDANAVSTLPGVVRVVPNAGKARLLPLIIDQFGEQLEPTTAERFGVGEGSCGGTLEPGLAGRTAYTLRVQSGCAEVCSYCIIPTTRGAPMSVPLGVVLRQVGRVTAAGYQEIVITGVHLGSYGRDLQPATTLGHLLRTLAERFRETLFRISSLEPMDCTPDIVNLAATTPAIAPHFHLPLQHASDRILAAMRRPYTIARYAALANTIRAQLPAAAIGADVIVGFPGEQDADAEQLVAYLEGSPLTHLHVFPYSDRPGTAASRLGGRAAGPAVRERAARVREVGRRLSERFRAAQIGTVRRGLTIDDGASVVTDNYLKLRIPPGLPRNERVRVEVLADGVGALCRS